VKTKVSRELEHRFEAQTRRWYRLTCPRCGSEVDVANERTRAWCCRHPIRVEMERSAS
jgi:hypothetical protein